VEWGGLLGGQDLRKAVDGSPDAFVAVDADGRILHWSPGAERLLGWSAEEVLGGADPGLSWQAPRVTRDGERITVQLTGWVPLETPGSFGVFFRSPGRDESQAHVRNRLSAELSGAATRGDVLLALDRALVDLIGATGSAVLTACQCGNHLVADPQGACEPPEARVAWIDRTVDPVAEDARPAVGHATLHTAGDPVHVCTVAMGPASAATWLAVAGVHDDIGDRHTLVTVRAVTDEAWVALQRAQLILQLKGRVDVLEARDASRTEAIAGVTHDLKAPVHVLRGFVETLRARPPDALDRGRALEAMDRQIGRIARLVDDLLLAARAADGPLRPGRLEPVDLGELVGAIRDGLEPSAQDRVTVTLAGALEALGDADQLARLITNLVDNALKYGGDGSVEVHLYGDGETVEVVVRDHGPGLTDEEREQVFGRFVVGRQGRDRGSTGLGLHVAREIARGHGGDLVARPHDPAAPGAVFRLVVPAAGARTDAN
jgi:signal transduction histidine kinase